MAARKILVATTVLILFVALLTPSTVLGAFSIGFQSGGTWVNDITGKVVGDTVDVSVYLQATEGDLAVGGTKGLISMGTNATFDPTLGNVTGSVVNGAQFDEQPGTDHDNINGTLFYEGQVKLGGAGVKGESIWLGDFSYRIDSAGTNVFRFGDRDPSNPGVDHFLVFDSQNDDFIPLDNILFGANLDGTYNLSITAVPEPSSLMLGLSALAIGGAVAWRRRSAR